MLQEELKYVQLNPVPANVGAEGGLDDQLPREVHLVVLRVNAN